jgi:hypothetical protein
VQFQAAGAEATPVFESLDLGRMSVSARTPCKQLFPSAPHADLCVSKLHATETLTQPVPGQLFETGTADMCSAVEAGPDAVARLLKTATAAKAVRDQLLHHFVPDGDGGKALPREDLLWCAPPALITSSLARSLAAAICLPLLLLLSAAACSRVGMSACAALLPPRSSILCLCTFCMPVSCSAYSWPVDCGPGWTERSSSPCR